MHGQNNLNIRTGGTVAPYLPVGVGRSFNRGILIKAGDGLSRTSLSRVKATMMSKMSKMSMAFFRHLTLVRPRSARGFPSCRLLPTTDLSEKAIQQAC